MPLQIGDLSLIYSGGNGNTSQGASFGGDPSTAAGKRVTTQTPTFVDANPDLDDFLTITRANGNNEGQGTLTWDNPTQVLFWKAPGSPVPLGKTITADGDYNLGNASGYLEVNVNDFANLTNLASASDPVSIARALNTTFDDVSATESLAGLVEYRCFYVENSSVDQNGTGVRIWLESQPLSGIEMDIAFDDVVTAPTTATTSLGTRTIVDETDSTNQLSGLTWVRPSSYNAALDIGNLNFNERIPFWVRRTVPVEHRNSAAPDFSRIVLSGFAA